MNKNKIGRYNGHDWKYQRICDIMYLESKAFAYFLYEDGQPTGTHFLSLSSLMEWVDNRQTDEQGEAY